MRMTCPNPLCLGRDDYTLVYSTIVVLIQLICLNLKGVCLCRYICRDGVYSSFYILSFTSCLFSDELRSISIVNRVEDEFNERLKNETQDTQRFLSSMTQSRLVKFPHIVQTSFSSNGMMRRDQVKVSEQFCFHLQAHYNAGFGPE